MELPFSARAKRGLAAVGLLSLIWTQPYRPVVFVGASMSPTYPSGSVAIAKRFRGTPQPGDVVVLKTDRGKIVKRIAYIGGDKVPQVRVIGKWMDASPFFVERAKSSPIAQYREIKVPAGHIYVLGDNYAESEDSRNFGFLPVESIEQIVVTGKLIGRA
jgi:signal peptidase I